MFKFFRKIRQNLILSRDFKKYLIYAAGEILLVMIGILLALQVNNWNESRKTYKKEKILLQGLLSDFENNKRLIKKGRQKHKHEKDLGETWIKMMNKDTTGVKMSPRLDSLLFWAPTYTVIDLFDASLNNIIRGDKLDIIKNEEIKQLLLEYPIYINKYKDVEVEIRRIVIEKIRPQGEKNLSLRQLYDGNDAFSSDLNALFRDRQLCNDYVNKNWQLDELLLHLDILESITDNLISKIDIEVTERF